MIHLIGKIIIIAVAVVIIPVAIIAPILATELSSKHEGVVIINVHGLNDHIINMAKKDEKMKDIFKHSKIKHIIYSQDKNNNKGKYYSKFFSSNNLKVSDNNNNNNNPNHDDIVDDDLPFTKLLHHKNIELELITNLNFYSDLGKAISLNEDEVLEEYNNNEIASELLKTNLSLLVGYGNHIIEEDEDLYELLISKFNTTLNNILDISNNVSYPLSIIMDEGLINEYENEFLNISLHYLENNSSYELFKDKKLTLLETDSVEKSLIDEDIIGAVAKFKKLLNLIKQWKGYKNKNILILSIPSKYEIIPDDNNDYNDDTLIEDDNDDQVDLIQENNYEDDDDNKDDDNDNDNDDNETDIDIDEPLSDIIDQIDKDNCLDILYMIRKKTSIEINKKWCKLWNMIGLLKKMIMDKVNKKLGMTVQILKTKKQSLPFISFGKIKKINLKSDKIEELGDNIAKLLKFKLINEYKEDESNNIVELLIFCIFYIILFIFLIFIYKN